MLNIKVLLATFLFSFTAFATTTYEISQTQLISLQQAAKAQKFILLDVRSTEEFNQGHIPGAINISHDKIIDNLSMLTAYKNTEIIIYCRSGRRAGVAADLLAEHGFMQLSHLTGDMNGWQAHDRPIATVKNP